MAYASWSVVAGEQPSAAKWNILGTNDAAFNNGTGLPSAGAVANYVATTETTSSTSYTGLTTPETVTVVVGTTGMLLVGIAAQLSNNTTGSIAYKGFALSSANTLASADKYCIFNQSYNANGAMKLSGMFLLTGLNAGSTVVTAQYRANANTMQALLRNICAVPL